MSDTIDGFVIGIKLPTKTDWDWPRYVKPEYRDQCNPKVVPLEIGQLVSKSFRCPADISQKWIVVGMYFNNFEGWITTIVRRGETEFHRNSLYRVEARLLYKMNGTK